MDDDRSDEEKLLSLVGKTVRSVESSEKGEGFYSLTFADGIIATFSAVGDDMTYVTFSLEKSYER